MTQGEARPIEVFDTVRQLQALVDDISTGLSNQQELLKVRGFSLPAGTLQNIAGLRTKLTRLDANLRGELTELAQLRALVETSAMMNSSLNVDAVLSAAMDQIVNLTGAERGYILLRNQVTGELEFRIARDQSREGQPADGKYQISNTILQSVVATGEAMLTDNAIDDPRVQDSSIVTRYVLRSVMCVPLKHRDKLIGVIYVDNRYRVAVFTPRELRVLKAFANQVAIAIENARLYARVRAALVEITEVKDLMENVFGSITSGVLTIDAETCVITYNAAAAEMLGHPGAALVGQRLRALIPQLPDDFEQTLQAVREENLRVDLEVEPEIDGRGRTVLSLKLSPLRDASDQTQGVAMVMENLTEEREREAVIDLMRNYLPPGMLDRIHHIARLALGGERREVTCIFADVCPLETFPQDLKAEQIMELLNAYLTVATDTIHRARGLIDKYVGTEIMVLFNTQLNPMEDHAHRALDAALELRRALVQLYQAMNLNPEQHYYRIGIHTGIATVGNVGSLKRRNFTALGDTINLAKRLQENARPGQIIASDDTVQHLQRRGDVSPYLRLTEQEAIRVKGRQQEVLIYEVART